MAYRADLAVRDYLAPEPTYVFLVETAFMAAYTVELMIRLWRDRCFFFFDESYLYNWVDIFLLVMMYYFTFTTSVRDVTYLRAIRMLRLMKVLRVFRLIAAFKTLRAILMSLANTMGTLMWSVILLTVVLYVFALLFVQSAAMYFQDKATDLDPAHFEMLSRVYGGMWTAFLSLFMCSTGGHDWIVCYEPIVLTGAVNQGIFLFFVAFTQIAVMNIILGIFVDNAMKRMMIEKEEAASEHIAEEQRTQEALIALCNELDKDKDGKITRNEWRAALNHAGVMSYLDLMGFHVHNVIEYYEVMSKGSDHGAVDISAFVSGCMRLKGWATCYDMQVLLGQVKEVLVCVHEQKARMQALLQDFGDSELSGEEGN
jgi:voltage-gated sodium channel